MTGDFPALSCSGSTQTFLVGAPVAGLSYSWSVTSGLQIVGATTGNSVSIKVIGNGDQYVNLNVVTATCGTQQIAAKKVSV
ncbi:hypothetical protein [Adhaeribacter pallidiroseus]|uniref:hypothetical protein n=1 Tax=Adhaeribacter pallidiroseus TaxID=2072847 RepID=UPI003743DD44